MAGIPPFPSFDIEADKSSAAHRWNKWVGRLENLLVGLNITNDGRKRALLLHYAGERVYDIYDAEKGDTGTNYDETKKVITDYFAPKVNKQMEIYKFRACKQSESQSLDEYVTELRMLAKNCEFADTEEEILQQIIQNCKSSRLRRRALRDNCKTLTDIISLGRSLEISDEQAAAMESPKPADINKVKTSQDVPYRGRRCARRPTRGGQQFRPRNTETTKCRNCGGRYPHNGQCPARGKTCNFCKKPNHFMTVCRKKQKDPEVRQIEKKTDSCSSDDDYCYALKSNVSKTPKSNVKINDVQVNVLVDSGASVNILDENTYSIIGKPKLSNRNLPKLLPYGSQSPLKIIGKCKLTIEKQKIISVETFYIVQGRHGSLISYQTACNLNIIEIVNQIQENKQEDVKQDKYPNLFKGIGNFKTTMQQ
ncbi:uncharacterized protein LOC132713564 [Ruditapes philippinarum]|uniref:uncharacterized protein LOC132713564 n=1 Tax=Ruditapes philippinarum TaxID=129788 RepID=UPI00295B027B|nr:uncharacterized protein LOC132713564 [Ruditapes philippinarum]